MMNILKNVLSGVLVTVLLMGVSFAEGQIGVVDLAKIGQEYNEARTLRTQASAKEEELKKLREDLAQRLKEEGEGMSPLEKKTLEERLSQEFVEKFKAYREWRLANETSMNDKVEQAIQGVARDKQIDIILAKPAVLQGGQDITSDVIFKLNQ